MSTIQVGRVCPGGIFCEEAVHSTLVLFDIIAPYIIGHLCLPLVVRARVQYVYAHLVNTEDVEEREEGSKGANVAAVS